MEAEETVSEKSSEVEAEASKVQLAEVGAEEPQAEKDTSPKTSSTERPKLVSQQTYTVEEPLSAMESSVEEAVDKVRKEESPEVDSEEDDEEIDPTKLSEMTDSSSKSMIIYRDSSTWTAEDGMPTPPESPSPSLIDSPSHEYLMGANLADFLLLPEVPEGAEELDAIEDIVVAAPDVYCDQAVTPPPQFDCNPHRGHHGDHRHRHQSNSHHHHHRGNGRQDSCSGHKRHHHQTKQDAATSAFGHRVYENVPPVPFNLMDAEQLVAAYPMFSQQDHTSGADQVQFAQQNFRKHNKTTELLNVTDLLMGAGGNGNNSVMTTGSSGPAGSSRNSWADSGRESLSFDGEGNHNNGGSSGSSSKNMRLYPPPAPLNTSTGTTNVSNVTTSSSFAYISNRRELQNQQQQQHPSFLSPSPPPPPPHQNLGTRDRGQSGRRHHHKNKDRHLTRQERVSADDPHSRRADDINFNQMFIPSPRRTPAGGPPGHPGSPISLQRHPTNLSQRQLQENKRSRPLIPCESPYIISPHDWIPGGGGHVGFPTKQSGRSKSPAVAKLSGVGRQGTYTKDSSGRGEDMIGASRFGRAAGSALYRPGVGGTSSRAHQSFDYGELPSHQMFPKRHLLQHQGVRQHLSHFPHAAGKDMDQGPNNHRSFPAGVFSGISPRSCSLGDLSSGNVGGPGSLLPPSKLATAQYQGPSGGYDNGASSTGAGAPLMPAPPIGGYNANNVPLVGSLPIPPSTSVTYEFSLAPVTGSLAPGWHLTAVQRGLADAVPLAAVVARRRLPRPRPSMRSRFGFTDKSEARRAKWTIAVTALALLAMSLLLVGVTLRLAPLIDDLVRKENENLLKVIHHPGPTALNDTSTASSTNGSSDDFNSSTRSPDNIDDGTYLSMNQGGEGGQGDFRLIGRHHHDQVNLPPILASNKGTSHFSIDLNEATSTTSASAAAVNHNNTQSPKPHEQAQEPSLILRMLTTTTAGAASEAPTSTTATTTTTAAATEVAPTAGKSQDPPPVPTYTPYFIRPAPPSAAAPPEQVSPKPSVPDSGGFEEEGFMPF